MRSTGLAKSSGEVLGENFLRIRTEQGQTQREAAAYLADHGVTMSPSNVASLEGGGRATASLELLLQLSFAYRVPLTEWFAGEGSVQVNQHARIGRDELRDVLQGREVDLRTLSTVAKDLYVITEPERALAQQLHMAPEAVAKLATSVWGRSVQEERDQRVGDLADVSPRSAQARRGHVTRQLVAELRAHLGVQESTAT